MSKISIAGCVFASVALSCIAALIVVGSTHQTYADAINSMNERLAKVEFTAEMDESAYLDPIKKGFSVVNGNSGIFLVSIEKVEPYLDGYKLYLSIGNPMMVTYKGFDIDLRYGESIESGMSYDEWKKSLKHIQVSSTTELIPGSWNNEEIVIAPAKPNEIKHIEVQIGTGVVSLLTTKV